MNILNVTSHMGGGVGSVLMAWIGKENAVHHDKHSIMCLDYLNPKASAWADRNDISINNMKIEDADIVVLHYWPHPMLKNFLSKRLPPCRLIVWCHNNSAYSQAELNYPDLWLDTSPVQNHGRHIWSCGDITRFLEIKPKVHGGFNVGYMGEVSYQGKMHQDIFDMCNKINIPGVRFTFVGENKTAMISSGRHTFTGKVDNVAPYLAEMDCFFYPLRHDHTGTAEQVLGESMAAGVVPVVLNNQAERIILGDKAGLIAAEEQYVPYAINMLYESAAYREELSIKSRERARQLYNIDRMISEWNAVFEEVMKMPKRERGTLC